MFRVYLFVLESNHVYTLHSDKYVDYIEEHITGTEKKIKTISTQTEPHIEPEPHSYRDIESEFNLSSGTISLITIVILYILDLSLKKKPGTNPPT